MNETLKNRLLSLAWRVGGMVVVTVASFVIANAADLNIPAWGTVFAGLVVGEVTKYLNTQE